MDEIVFNAVFGYFEALYELNQNLIMCCGLDVINNSGQFDKPVEVIIQNIPRLIPYVYNKKTEQYVIKKEGLLEFETALPFLENGYKELLQDNYVFLSNIKRIRNKLEHNMHATRMTGSESSSGLALFELIYTVESEELHLMGKQFVDCIKGLNLLFSEIQKNVRDYGYNAGKGNYLYFQRLIRYDFADFNPIYDSELLKSFGQALFPF